MSVSLIDGHIDNDKLKPCKCGGNARVTIDYVVGKPISYRVVCDKCNKSTKATNTEHEAIALWNGGVADAT